MNPEEIKFGETYNVRMKVETLGDIHHRSDEIGFLPDYKNSAGGKVYIFPKKWLSEILSPANGTKNAEPAPKYDPCRLFKAGDIVEPVSCNGRAPLYLRKYIGTKQVVECDEDNNGIVGIVGDIEAVSAAFLKLVTPVEELEPYMVKELKDSYIVYHDCTKIILNETSLVSKFMKASHPNAKEAAEAECDRLNAEYRKECKNG